MAKRTSVLLEHTNKTSWFAALSMLIIACILPTCLVQFFQPHPLHYHQIKQAAVQEIKQSAVQETPAIVKKVLPPPTKPIQAASQVTPKAMIQPRTQTIVIQKGDTLGRIFKRAGLSAKNLQEVMQAKPQSRWLTHLKIGQTLTFTIEHGRLKKLVFPYSFSNSLVITETAHHYESSAQQQPSTARRQFVAATLRGSLYNTAKRKQIPYQLIQQMTTILSREVDFKKGTRMGDHFDILYEARYIDDKQVNTGDILAVRYTNKGITHEAVRYTNKDGSTNYYTPQGLSLKKAYDRYPVRFSHIASPFSLTRYHPILHYRRPHYGIDLAAPMGTPIHAIGDGRLEIIHWKSGYGNMIKIHHNDMYSTIYGHLSRFEKGLVKGQFVKRGQVIGYVGQSGLASGPHCHFEFHKYQHPINPTTINLPHADPVPHHEMAKFKTTAKRILAQLTNWKKSKPV
ncbi:MAG: peptidoglycan DD-metalloendopeptidase family protein [Gammaproteobacteria bacterium]|nr:peptidoglycan DD-metalloendopeptidase family protein [Gammaproteobacteria bacterium]